MPWNMTRANHVRGYTFCRTPFRQSDSGGKVVFHGLQLFARPLIPAGSCKSKTSNIYKRRTHKCKLIMVKENGAPRQRSHHKQGVKRGVQFGERGQRKGGERGKFWRIGGTRVEQKLDNRTREEGAHREKGCNGHVAACA